MKLLKFGKGKKKLSETIGLTRETAEQLLEDLFKARAEAQKKYDELSVKQPPGARVESLDMSAVRQQLERIDDRVAQIRDWYGLHVLEGLEEESRRLKWLTVVLIVLTFVLIIFTALLLRRI